MTAIAVVNNLSWPTPSDEARLETLVVDFGRVIRAARKLREDLDVVLPEGVSSLVVTNDGLTIYPAVRRSGGKALEAWRVVQSARDRTGTSLHLPEELEYRFRSEAAEGLGFAHIAERLAVSFQSATEWSVDSVELQRTRLLENEAGVAEIETSTVSVRHASSLEHVEAHRDFITGFSSGSTTEALWGSRMHRFPHLYLLKGVEGQLRSYDTDPESMSQIEARLVELEATFAAWVPSAGLPPAWRSKVTPEGQERSELARFVDDDGVSYLFDHHARFTPGAGRIHFRWISVSDIPQLRIAYIGPKLQ